ncbi:hypothetical protein M5689_021337 [Euphorbia peplus]|nr:hypothetical protein M5689_021337 [Euphorbia peplus]
MVISKWLCTKNSRNMVVKIVHPGGHKELHDRTLLASEIMNRNPKSVVAYPDVFQQPWNIVEPDTMLMLGHKYYVVPTSTVRKLQRKFLRNSSPSQSFEGSSGDSSDAPNMDDKETFKGKMSSRCPWIIAGKDDEKCFLSMFNGVKTKASSETKRKKSKIRSTSRSLTSDDHWQPGLECITEELSISNNNFIREEHTNSKNNPTSNNVGVNLGNL